MDRWADGRSALSLVIFGGEAGAPRPKSQGQTNKKGRWAFRWTDGPMDRWTDVRPWANGARWRDSLVIFGAQVAGQTKRERAMGFPMDRWTDEPMADGRSRLVLCHWSYLEAKSPGLARAE